MNGNDNDNNSKYGERGRETTSGPVRAEPLHAETEGSRRNIIINALPNVQTLRDWKLLLWENIAQASWAPDQAFMWAQEVEIKKFDELYDSGQFVTLDTKLSAALTSSSLGSWLAN